MNEIERDLLSLVELQGVPLELAAGDHLFEQGVRIGHDDRGLLL